MSVVRSARAFFFCLHYNGRKPQFLFTKKFAINLGITALSAQGEKTRHRERERVKMNKKENIRGIFSQLTHLFSRKVESCASRCGSY